MRILVHRFPRISLIKDVFLPSIVTFTETYCSIYKLCDEKDPKLWMTAIQEASVQSRSKEQHADYPIPLGPVSYTHLDVYKRQIKYS